MWGGHEIWRQARNSRVRMQQRESCAFSVGRPKAHVLTPCSAAPCPARAKQKSQVGPNREAEGGTQTAARQRIRKRKVNAAHIGAWQPVSLTEGRAQAASELEFR